MSSDQPSPSNDTASAAAAAGHDAQPSEAAATATAHKVLTYSLSRSSTKTGGSDTLRKNDKATKAYHAQRAILSLVLAALVMAAVAISGSGSYIGKLFVNKYFVQGNSKIVQNQIMTMASYSNTVITNLFGDISFPSAYAAESSSSSDDDDSSDNNGGEEVHPFYCLRENPDRSCHMWSNVQHFYNHMSEMEHKWSTCNTEYDEDNEYAELIDVKHSQYQKIIFEENLHLEDKCLWLDHTMQQCATYRPHYHEPFVHLSAAYTDVKRVVFVGGGDSMLLHEVLKYPSLEMVLGLELDQVVTRNSFEHFKTQPHFDDERVQWWFGDGAKSLTLLPREYFGTFDLVLLDLSETVMSMTVTEGLDVFGAMKLLLSPTGIMVKNDFGYFEGFDHLKGVEGSTFNVDTL
eukprot:scaffold23458_cov83-Skeletonema_marinoi.AAC.1